MAGTQSGTGEENLTKERKDEDADGTLHGGDREPDSGGNDDNKRGKRRRTHASNGEDKDSGRAESVSRSVASTGNDLKANAPKSKEARLYWIKFKPADRQNWTPEQNESAIKITSQDLIGCAVLLLLTEIHCEDATFPDRFSQAGAAEYEEGSSVLGLLAVSQNTEVPGVVYPGLFSKHPNEPKRVTLFATMRVAFREFRDLMLLNGFYLLYFLG